MDDREVLRKYLNKRVWVQAKFIHLAHNQFGYNMLIRNVAVDGEDQPIQHLWVKVQSNDRDLLPQSDGIVRFEADVQYYDDMKLGLGTARNISTEIV